MPIKTITKGRINFNVTTPTFKASSNKPSTMAAISPPKSEPKINSQISSMTHSIPIGKTEPKKNSNLSRTSSWMARLICRLGHPPTKIYSCSFETASKKMLKSISTALDILLPIINLVLVLTRITSLAETNIPNF